MEAYCRQKLTTAVDEGLSDTSLLTDIPHVKQYCGGKLVEYFNDAQTIQAFGAVVRTMRPADIELRLKAALQNERARRCVLDTVGNRRRIVVHDYNWYAYNMMLALLRVLHSGINRGGNSMRRVVFIYAPDAALLPPFPMDGDTLICDEHTPLTPALCAARDGAWINAACVTRPPTYRQWDGYHRHTFDGIITPRAYGRDNGLATQSVAEFLIRLAAKRAAAGGGGGGGGGGGLVGGHNTKGRLRINVTSKVRYKASRKTKYESRAKVKAIHAAEGTTGEVERNVLKAKGCRKSNASSRRRTRSWCGGRTKGQKPRESGHKVV